MVKLKASIIVQGAPYVVINLWSHRTRSQPPNPEWVRALCDINCAMGCPTAVKRVKGN